MPDADTDLFRQLRQKLGSAARRKEFGCRELNPRTLACMFSDYSADNNGTEFSCFSYLLLSDDELRRLGPLFQGLRHQHGISCRQFEYKALSDKVRFRVLPHFLAVANNIEGICIAFLISKAALSKLLQHHVPVRLIPKLFPDIAQLQYRGLARAILAFSLGAIAVGAFVPEESDVSWLSDNDSIFPNNNVSDKSAALISSIFNVLVMKKMGHLSTGTIGDSDQTTGSRAALSLCKDLLSVCDLSVAINSRSLVNEALTANKDLLLQEWWSQRSERLGKVSVVVSCDDKHFVVRWGLAKGLVRHR